MDIFLIQETKGLACPAVRVYGSKMIRSSYLLENLRQRRSVCRTGDRARTLDSACGLKNNTVTAAWPVCCYPASYPDLTPPPVYPELTCGYSGLGRVQPHRSHPGSPSPQVHVDEAGEVGPW